MTFFSCTRASINKAHTLKVLNINLDYDHNNLFIDESHIWLKNPDLKDCKELSPLFHRPRVSELDRILDKFKLPSFFEGIKLKITTSKAYFSESAYICTYDLTKRSKNCKVMLTPKKEANTILCVADKKFYYDLK